MQGQLVLIKNQRMFLFLLLFPPKNCPGAWRTLEVLVSLFSHMSHPSLDLRNIFMPRPMCLTVQVSEEQSTNIAQDYFKNSLAL